MPRAGYELITGCQASDAVVMDYSNHLSDYAILPTINLFFEGMRKTATFCLDQVNYKSKSNFTTAIHKLQVDTLYLVVNDTMYWTYFKKMHCLKLSTNAEKKILDCDKKCSLKFA